MVRRRTLSSLELESTELLKEQAGDETVIRPGTRTRSDQNQTGLVFVCFIAAGRCYTSSIN